MKFIREGSEMVLEVLIPEQAPLRFDAADVLSLSEGKLRVRFESHVINSFILTGLTGAILDVWKLNNNYHHYTIVIFG